MLNMVATIYMDEVVGAVSIINPFKGVIIMSGNGGNHEGGGQGGGGGGNDGKSK